MKPILAHTYGSPPRAWGIRRLIHRRPALARFTPTCVGNTLGTACLTDCAPVHPHVRGEYRKLYRSSFCGCGSPPRAWGILEQRQQAVSGRRFTPTCVGNTQIRPFAGPSCPVHPHVRGEYRNVCENASSAFGSPPRAWGILRSLHSLHKDFRFTPTCVGNTCREGSMRSRASVHPHVRGEYAATWNRSGSMTRFTPTCVGNTH